MQQTYAAASHSLKPVLVPLRWAPLLILCSGCPATNSTGPDLGPLSDFPPSAATTTMVEPSLSLTGSYDQRPQIVTPSVEQANREAHDQGLLVDIFFDFDRSELSAKARADLEHNAQYLNRSSAFRVLIEGHCDERGTNEYNLALGHLRATTAREYLIRLGIAAERLDSISYGEERGVCHASSERCWARNRRAYLRIVDG